MTMKARLLILLAVIMLILTSVSAYCLEAPGIIIFEKDGGLYSIQPDGRGQKKIADNGTGPAICSPDGTKVAYFHGHRIYVTGTKEKNGQLLYQGKDSDELRLIMWNAESNAFFFKKLLPDGRQQFFRIDDEKKLIKDLGIFYEPPHFFSSGDYWAYSDYNPKNPKSEVHGGLPGEKGNYIFHGRMTDVLGWDKSIPVLLYNINDKIFGFHVVVRERQVFNLPFKDVTVISFGYPSILFYHNDPEAESSGLKLYDPERGEQSDLIDNKKSFALVSHNFDLSKMVVFAPTKPQDPLGEGELYLVEIKEAKSTKITKDIGERVLKEINMNSQWSPDGKYFVYEKLKLRFSNIKNSEIYIAGEGKDEILLKKAGHPVWCK